MMWHCGRWLCFKSISYCMVNTVPSSHHLTHEGGEGFTWAVMCCQDGPILLHRHMVRVTCGRSHYPFNIWLIARGLRVRVAKQTFMQYRPHNHDIHKTTDKTHKPMGSLWLLCKEQILPPWTLIAYSKFADVAKNLLFPSCRLGTYLPATASALLHLKSSWP